MFKSVFSCNVHVFTPVWGDGARQLVLVVLVLLVGTLGCQSASTTTTTITTRDAVDLDEEFEEEELTEEQIQDQIKLRIDGIAAGVFLMDVGCRDLIQYGEKSIHELSKNIENSILIVRIAAIYCLGQIYENTKSSAILELHPRLFDRYLNDPVLKVRMEAASTLCCLGDYTGVPLLLEALRHKEAYVRLMAVRQLQHIAGQNYGYNHNAPPAIREQQAQLWDQWWLTNRERYLSQRPK